MNPKSYSFGIVDISIAAYLERHPEMTLSKRARDAIMNVCEKLDGKEFSTDYSLTTDVSESGDVVITLTDPENGDFRSHDIVYGAFELK